MAELQLIKGWVSSEGALHTEVLSIARAEEPAASLCTVFEDAKFDATQPSFYYLRVVEPERPRWHTYDCAALPEALRPAACSDGSYPDTVREMAWTSPIWYQPAS